VTDLSLDAALSAADIDAAVAAGLAVLPSPYPLQPAATTRDPAVAAFAGVAGQARFRGGMSGTVVVAIDDSLTQALAAAPVGSLDPAAALAPALQAVAATVGPVTLGPIESLDAQSALNAILAAGGVIVPLVTTEAMVGAIAIAVDAPLAEPASGAFAPGGLELLRTVEMEVCAELGRARMSLDELLGLGEGAVIELDRAAGAPADLLVNGRLIARGEVVVVDENFGLRITEIVTGATAR
jgi:flagellar motor switch protein FliN/FliY